MTAPTSTPATHAVLDAVDQAIAHMTRPEIAALSELIALRLNESAGRTLLNALAAFEPVLTADDLARLEANYNGHYATGRQCWDATRILGNQPIRALTHLESIQLGKQLSARYASKKRGPIREFLIAPVDALTAMAEATIANGAA